MKEITKLKWKLSMLSGVYGRENTTDSLSNIQNLPNLSLENSKDPFRDADRWLSENIENYTLIAKGIDILNTCEWFKERTEPNRIISQCQGHNDWARYINEWTHKTSDVRWSLFSMNDIGNIDKKVQSFFISTLVGNAWAKSTPSMNWDYPQVLDFDEKMIRIKTSKKGLFVGSKGVTIKEIERKLKRRIILK